MSFSSSTKVLFGLLAVAVSAQDAPVSLCTSEACDWCPNSITTTGTGYPTCVVYDRDTVLGGKEGDYEPEINGQRAIWYDIADLGSDSECRTIIRSPADTTVKNCGTPIYGGTGGLCFKGDTKSTFMVQFCCGTGDCTAAGLKRDGLSSASFSTAGGGGSAVFYDAVGDLIAPIAVGDQSGDKFDTFLEDHGVNASSLIKARSVDGVPVYKIGYAPEAPAHKKRDCDEFVQDGDDYTKTGDTSYQVSAYICNSNSKVTITNENSVSRTTTFGASISDPWGIVSASTEFSTEESASQSFAYEYTPNDSQCGHLSWTPYFICVKGTIPGCDGGDQVGEVCTAKRVNSGQLDGAFVFVQTD